MPYEPSSTSSCTRNALWNSSSAVADSSACSVRPPTARHAAKQVAGRSPFPSRNG